MVDDFHALRLLPRALPRTWGRSDIKTWVDCAGAHNRPVGMISLSHASNYTEDSQTLGQILADSAGAMLGDLGRAPPNVRLFLTQDATEIWPSCDAISYWRIVHAEPKTQIHVRWGERSRTLDAVPGAEYAIATNSPLFVDGGIVALEISPAFLPKNALPPMMARRLIENARKPIDDVALGVEHVLIDGALRLKPEPERCRIITALSADMSIEGQPIGKHQCVFVPAGAASIDIKGRGDVLMADPGKMLALPQRRPAATVIARTAAPSYSAAASAYNLHQRKARISGSSCGV